MSLITKQHSAFSNGLIFFACAFTFCAGCTSIESTMVTRDETNQTWERHNCLNGIPITLKVPTHLKLYVFHKHYLELRPVKVNGTDKVQVVPVDVDVVVRDFAHEFMYTDKIFVVDFKRPPAGTSNLLVGMTEEQYIDEIQHDITDETIAAVGGLLGALTGAEGDGQGQPTGARQDMKEIKSLVAVGIFEIDAPDFEEKVRQFLDCHVNKSHDAWVVPPYVDGIKRLGIHPRNNVRVPYPPVPLCPENGECQAESSGKDWTNSPEEIPTPLSLVDRTEFDQPLLDTGGR